MILKKKVSVGNCLKRKTMLVGVKEDMKKTSTCKSVCNLQEFFTAFRVKHQT